MLKSGSELIGTAALAAAGRRLGQQPELFLVFKVFPFQTDHILAGHLIRGVIDVDQTNPRLSRFWIEEIGKIEMLKLSVHETYQGAAHFFSSGAPQQELDRSITEGAHVFAIKADRRRGAHFIADILVDDGDGRAPGGKT